jgi:hypothetical protein
MKNALQEKESGGSQLDHVQCDLRQFGRLDLVAA